MAKSNKLKGLISKNATKIIAGAGALTVILGIGIGSRFSYRQNVPEMQPSTDPVYGTGQVEPDIYTLAEEETIKEPTLEFDTISPETESSNINIVPDPKPSIPNDNLTDDTFVEDTTIYDEPIEETSPEQETDVEIVIPSEDKAKVKQNYEKLLTSLNSKVKDYLNSKNNKKHPVITGIEKIDVIENAEIYQFTMQLEGSFDNESISYFNLSLSNDSIEGANIYDLSMFESVSMTDLLEQLDELVMSDSTQISSIKTLVEANIINKNTAINTLDINLTEDEIKSSKIKAYVMTSVQNTLQSYVYQSKVNVKTETQTYFSTLTIASSAPLKTAELGNYVSAILNNQVVDVDFNIETIAVNNNKINSLIDKVNQLIEEEGYTK